ncbi:hypothetical protein HYX14_00060 [Candidatus Woesearchaeota archaeon]|nr:hypothetical protein [Candidatus Woesearchaeota archaeon]
MTEKEEFEQKKKILLQSRAKYAQLSREQEAVFRERRSIRDRIRGKLGRVRKLKQERDQLTAEVKKVKVERDKQNVQLKGKLDVKREADKKQKEVLAESGIKDGPIRIKLQIHALEKKLETEVMAFSNEQQMRKKIKELKDRFKEIEQLGTVFHQTEEVRKDFREVRRTAEELHEKVQVVAAESQHKHNDITHLFEELDTLREQEKPLIEKEQQLKTAIATAKRELDEIEARVNELAKLFKEEEEKSFQQIAREKTAEVKEKLSKRKKLTTEDILAFQAMKE